MENIGIKITIGLIKAIACVYDVITFPVYFLIQQPWIAWEASSTVWAKRLKDDNPYSPYCRIYNPPPNDIGDSRTLEELFRTSVISYNSKDCFGTREVLGEEDELQKDGKTFRKLILGEYRWISYNEADKKIDQISRGLLEIGVRPKHSICIFAETRIEWILAAQACFRINVPIVTLYATLGEDGIVHGINETEVTHVITSQDLLPKLKKISPRISTLSHIIYMEGMGSLPLKGFPDSVKLLPFSRLEALGSISNSGLCGETPGPNDIAIIMYTSGSTGIPKGVILTHKNVLAAVKGFASICPVKEPNDLYIAYLPLAHVLELSSECFFISVGMPVGYSSPFTLTDKSTAIKKGCKGDATLLRPTVMACVPLILDRIRKGVLEVVEAKGKFSKAFFEFALKYKLFWIKKGFKTPILDWLVFRKVKSLIGGRVRAMASGSAPLSPDTHDFIRACICNIMLQGYGLTETAASATIMSLEDMSTGRVGAPLEGIYIKLADWDEGGYHVKDKPYPRGEIVIGGDCVASGYYKNQELTRESFKDDGGVRWFYTGDIGEIHSDGSVKIIDRRKDLVKLQYGEYISLGKVEAELKTSPYVDNICVYGNSLHSYLVALIVPNENHLTNLAKDLNKNMMSFSELCHDAHIISSVVSSIKEHAMKSGRLLKTEIPLRVKLCTEEWNPDSGLVTAAFKLRRRVIQQFYQKYLDEMYNIESNGPTIST